MAVTEKMSKKDDRRVSKKSFKAKQMLHKRDDVVLSEDPTMVSLKRRDSQPNCWSSVLSPVSMCCFDSCHFVYLPYVESN